eukprot:CAMPEP_0202910922 /NCGR_PEP_ID=MMETSP1392-20130828/53463_1 /ASSEMBLY_ACC=CAM_ASM_000868 /TAXON_ID=225041 /ORGANISM="Chlamydomonas chlamydogama, Strain SAG 11-48b" /LENGTH=228 /DNA_ID=CAMNT_0049601211 /DNA_START=82 /DNA_END=768 /DNA_ORIENTATION=+
MEKRIIRGVVFDMDGTLTIPVIDFAEMRRRAGVPQGQDILDAINSWADQAQRDRAYRVIAEIEEEALQQMRVMPGALDLCHFLDRSRVPRGLITRNVKAGVDHFHTHHLSTLQLPDFNPAISRECSFPYKPSPAALLHICATWGIPPSECVMIGDSVKDDVVCGNRAGSITVLLDYQGRAAYTAEQFEGEQRPHHVVTSLADIMTILSTQYSVQAPPHPHNVVESAAA